MKRLPRSTRWEYGLPILVGLILVPTLGYIPLDSGPIRADVLEILVPLAISIGLLVFAVKVGCDRYDAERTERIVKYGWGGALASATVGGWWVALHLARDVPIGAVSDQVLTVLSFGVAAGVIAGTSRGRHRCGERRPERKRVLAETTWTNRSDANPILGAIADLLADLEGVEPTELEPLYDHIDPTVFEQLRATEESRWRLLFHTERYEVGVSSRGTVTVYDGDGRSDEFVVGGAS